MIAQDAYEPAYDDHGELLPTVIFGKRHDVRIEEFKNPNKIKQSPLTFIVPYLIGMIVGCGIMKIWGKI